MTGYIKDHRKELDSDVWLMPPLYHRTWQWLKYNVNHADNEIPMRDGSKMLIKRGQRLTSVRDIAKGISWYEGRKAKEPNPKTVSSILEWMEKTEMIKIERGKGNREYTLITLVNYEVYNEKEVQGNSKVTVDGEGSKQRADINNNEKELIKNEKKVKKEITYTPQFDEFWSAYPKPVEKVDCFATWQKIIKDGEAPEIIIQCAKNYGQYCLDEQTESRFIKHPKTFLNKQRYQEYLTQKLKVVHGGGNSGKYGRGNERTASTNGFNKAELESLYIGSPQVRVQQV